MDLFKFLNHTRRIHIAALTLSLLTATAWAHTAEHLQTSQRADYHAPIGIMGDHTHAKGETMLSYRYRTMSMSGLQKGTETISLSEAHDEGYMMVPKNMTMTMHMIGLMHAISDQITITAMVPYKEVDMTMQMKMMGQTHSHSNSSEGLGDISISALTDFSETSNQKTILQIGATLPTGRIIEDGGYGMQLGSGTLDPFIRLTHSRLYDTWSWGNQLSALIRYGETSKNYALGDQYDASVWASKLWTDALSSSLRLSGTIIGDLEGKSETIGSSEVNQTGRTYADVIIGTNWIGQSGWTKGHRLAIEYGIPVYERVSSIALKRDYWVAIGWQKTL